VKNSDTQNPGRTADTDQQWRCGNVGRKASLFFSSQSSCAALTTVVLADSFHKTNLVSRVSVEKPANHIGRHRSRQGQK